MSYTYTKNISNYPTLSAMPSKEDVWNWLHEHDGFDLTKTLYHSCGDLVYVKMRSEQIEVVSIHNHTARTEAEDVYSVCFHSFNLIEDTYTSTTTSIDREMYEALVPLTKRYGGAEVYVK